MHNNEIFMYFDTAFNQTKKTQEIIIYKKTSLQS